MTCVCVCGWVGAQLKIQQSSELVMHMLVLYGNTGCKMDLSSDGYTVGSLRKQLPRSSYTPCIEEHNIHAIFRWDCVWNIFQQLQGRSSLADNPIHCSTQDEGGQLSSVKFLQDTGLTLSITTLGTCIYRFGKKRKLLHRAGAEENTSHALYSADTERLIFKVCKYVHDIVATA